jgi:hypothetical protein
MGVNIDSQKENPNDLSRRLYLFDGLSGMGRNQALEFIDEQYKYAKLLTSGYRHPLLFHGNKPWSKDTDKLTTFRHNLNPKPTLETYKVFLEASGEENWATYSNMCQKMPANTCVFMKYSPFAATVAIAVHDLYWQPNFDMRQVILANFDKKAQTIYNKMMAQSNDNLNPIHQEIIIFIPEKMSLLETRLPRGNHEWDIADKNILWLQYQVWARLAHMFPFLCSLTVVNEGQKGTKPSALYCDLALWESTPAPIVNGQELQPLRRNFSLVPVMLAIVDGPHCCGKTTTLRQLQDRYFQQQVVTKVEFQTLFLDLVEVVMKRFGSTMNFYDIKPEERTYFLINVYPAYWLDLVTKAVTKALDHYASTGVKTVIIVDRSPLSIQLYRFWYQCEWESRKNTLCGSLMTTIGTEISHAQTGLTNLLREHSNLGLHFFTIQTDSIVAQQNAQKKRGSIFDSQDPDYCWQEQFLFNGLVAFLDHYNNISPDLRARMSQSLTTISWTKENQPSSTTTLSHHIIDVTNTWVTTAEYLCQGMCYIYLLYKSYEWVSLN